jgi:DNA-binding CsgD family transcriptional regulator
LQVELARTEVVPTREFALNPSERRVSGAGGFDTTNKEVATALFIRPKTVEAKLGRIYRKLDNKTRAELGRIIGEA